MREGKVKLENNILRLLEEKTDLYEDRIALGIRTSSGWKEFTYRGIGKLSKNLGWYLINGVGIVKGDRVAILSESKPEFGVAVFASVLAGAVSVPLDIKLTKYELISILSDCRPIVLLTSEECFGIAKELKKELDFIKQIILLDDVSDNQNYHTLYDLPDTDNEKWRIRNSKSTAFIIYTSGTTGAPKGVEITFDNMFSQLNDLTHLYRKFFGEKVGLSVLSILPMNHLFELTVGFSTFLNWGLSIHYTKSLKPKEILTIMQEKNINFMIVVPAFLKLLKSGIETEVKNSGLLACSVFRIMLFVAKFIPSYAIRKLIFYKIHKKFGGKFFGCISGGAPLDVSVGEFFETIGIRVFQGYGLSETGPVVSVNVDKRGDIASVGKPLDSFSVKIDQKSGELLLKGPSVMKGYYNRPELTADVIDKNGWLHTGDIANIDSDGHIHITGRIKNMIVLSGGKKVFPEEVETVLSKSDLFSEVCVFGSRKYNGQKDGCEDVSVVIVPSDMAVCDANGDKFLMERMLRAEVKRLSSRLASYKRPLNIIVNYEPLPKTTTRKIKRLDVKKLLKA